MRRSGLADAGSVCRIVANPTDTDGLAGIATPAKGFYCSIHPRRSALARRTLLVGHLNAAGHHQHLRLLAGEMAADYRFECSVPLPLRRSARR
jgi:hypothetical protein